MIINIINNKGCTGKTNTIVNLAAAFAGLGKEAMLGESHDEAEQKSLEGNPWL